MNPIQMVDTKTQYHKIKSQVDNAILEVMESSAFINGTVQDFASHLSSYQGANILFPAPMEQMPCKLP
jgi:hypothetical protein